MTPMEPIGGAIAIAQAIVGTCKAIDICVTAVRDSHETLDRWNVAIKSLQHISQQFEIVLRERNVSHPTRDSLEGVHYGVISTHLDRFNRDLRKLESNISSTNLGNRASTSRVSLRSKVKLALTMDWKENEHLLKWIEHHVTLLQINRDLIRGINDDNMNDVQRALGTGHASWEPVPTPETLDEPRVELDDWRSSAEGFAKHIAIQKLDPTDVATLAPTEVDWDLMPDTTEIMPSSTVSPVEQELRLRATIQQVDHLEASKIPVIASNVQLEVIRLSDEISRVKGLTPTFKETFQLQERYVNLLLSSIEKHPIFGDRAKSYVHESIIPNIDKHDPDLRGVWWSLGRMYCTLEDWAQAEDWLRRALLNGYSEVDKDRHHTEIEQISKMICKIYKRQGRPQFATALGGYLVHHVGYDPTKIPGDLEKAIKWCSDKDFEVRTEGDQLVFTHLKNAKGRSALHEAALDTEVNESIIPLLLKDDLLALRNASGDTALLLAVGKSNTAVARQLLKTPSLVHVRDREGRTPLHRCCDHKTLSLLLEALNGSMHRSSLTHADPDSHDASSLIDINSQDAYGKTALFMACAQGNLRTMKKLLDAGAHVNMVDNTGVCPILACSSCTGISLARREEMILRLRAKGADPDQQDIDEHTARRELRRLFSSSKAVNKFLSLEPEVELERYKYTLRSDLK
ncbi:e3 ubiquitin ligase HACE1 [Fusarium subglutinans]|uniref:E3 ubiquitin ligase HACE1 n=1 Tax=Gibberella subglutinans TaxID=42677 RepID=A0A8H5UUA3_GIBSU|nr:e3 ubiquitin ligase HACE1 [Fusarium subglutinans]KAF5597634.1 e3 ubiquitin ligase HACE1 [Fusarium subglutinans]